MSERINSETSDHPSNLYETHGGNEKADAESQEMSVSKVHPLQHKWAVFHSSNADWNTLHKLYSFATVEDFWGTFEHISQPSQMDVGTDLYLFKDGIAPSWSDPANKDGGRWVFNLDKSRTPGRADSCWMELAMACVGEQMGKYSDKVCGAVFSIRSKACRIILWVNDAEDSQATYSLGIAMKDKFGWTSKDGSFKFEAHRREIERTSK